MKFSFKIFLRNMKLKKLLKEIEATTEECDRNIQQVNLYLARNPKWLSPFTPRYNLNLIKRAELINQYRTIVESK